MSLFYAQRKSKNSSDEGSKSSGEEANPRVLEVEEDVDDQPTYAYAGTTKNPRWASLPDYLQPTESIHIPHHREKRFVPKTTKLSLLLCKSMKQVWRNKALLIIELLVPIFAIWALSIYVATLENDQHPEPIKYSPFGFDAVPLKYCSKLILSPRCDFTNEIVRRMTMQQERYRLINGSAYTSTSEFRNVLSGTKFGPIRTFQNSVQISVMAMDKFKPEDIETGIVCAVVEFHTNNTGLGDSPYVFPENVQYHIRLPAIQQQDATYKPDQRQISSFWDTSKMRTDRLRVGPRNRQDKYGGTPGYHSEGFLFLQRKIDYLILEMIWAKEKTSKEIGPDAPIQYAAIDNVHPLLQRFPYPPYQNANLVQLLTEQLATILVFCYMPLFIVNTWLLVKERQAGAKGHLSYYNINPWHSWVAWITYKMIFYSITLIPVVPLLMVSWNYNTERALINLSSGWVLYLFLWTYILNVLSTSCTISTWFSNATTASVVAGTYWLISYIPVAFMDRNVELLSLLTKYICCCSPNTGLMIGFQIIGLSEFNSNGIDWKTLFAEQFDLGHVIVIFLVSVIFRILLAVYFEHLLPSTNQYGFRIPWFYFCMLWWWRGELPKAKNNTVPKIGASQIEREHPDLFEPEPINCIHRRELVLSSVTKIINGVTILSRINLEFLEGEIFTILGGDKSGKSTLFSLCAARTGTSSGFISLKKRDIAIYTRYGRTNIGYCTENNFLYDYLTVEEHISFFVQLKGVLQVADAYEEIDRLVWALNLDIVRRVRAENLTPGQKRLLHIALAFGGGSKVVILDEPTRQMTIPECRTAWRFMDVEKKRRCVVIFTRSAEEASYLGDRMAILSNGEIQCKGTPTFLRAKFGGGYNLKIAKVHGHVSGTRIAELVSNLVPDTQVYDETARLLTITLPSECTPFFEQLFTILEAQKESLGISDVTITFTVMDEIYKKIDLKSAESHLDSEQKRHSKMYRLTSKAEFAHMKPTNVAAGRFSIFCNQLDLLLRKDLKFTFRRWLWHLGSVIITVAIVAYGIYQSNDYRFHYELDELTIDSIVEKVSLEIGHTPKCLVKCTDYVSDHASFCTILRQTLETYNFTLERASDSSMEHQLLVSYKKDVTTQSTPYMLAVDVRFRPSDIVLTVFFNNKLLHTPPLAVNILTNVLLRRMKVTTTGVNFSTNRISASNLPLPYTVADRLILTSNYRSGGFFAGLTLACAVVFCFPNMIIGFIQEKRFKHLQIIAGVNLFLFWLSKFLWNFLIWVVFGTAGLVILVMIIVQLDAMTTVEAQTAVAILCGCYGLCIFPIVGVLTFIPLFNESSLHGYMYSAILGFFIGPAGMSIIYILSNPFNEIEHRTTKHDTLARVHMFLLVFPGYALGAGLFQIHSTAIHREECGRLNSAFKDCNGAVPHGCCRAQPFHGFEDDGVLLNDIFLVAEGVIAFIVIILLETRLHKISSTWVRFKLRRKNRNRVSPENQEDALYLESTTEEINSEDYQVLIRKLDKRIHDVAMVKTLRLAIKQSQCFGFLGGRGSGTKTVLQMLAGWQNPTSGDVVLDDVGLYQNHNKYLSMIGYCPNESMLLNEMTGGEILRLIGIIRGIRKRDLDELVINSTIRFMIFAEMNHLVSTYDAGSLRKLSAAVALIGNPRVLLFEDPDTGLDPISRADTIKNIKTERQGGATMIICSENMDVCKTSCDRIGVLVDGQLKCVGSPQFLRESYCKGYSIVVQLIPEDPSFYIPEEKVEGEATDEEELVLPEGDEQISANHSSDSLQLPRTVDSMEQLPKIIIDAPENKKKNPYSVTVYDPSHLGAQQPREAGFRLRPSRSAGSVHSGDLEDLEDDDGEREDNASVASFAEELVPWQEELLPIMTYIETGYPDAQLVDAYPCFVHYHLPGEVNLSQLFSFMEVARSDFDLETYRVSMGSLEQLLLNYTRGQAPRLE